MFFSRVKLRCLPSSNSRLYLFSIVLGTCHLITKPQHHKQRQFAGLNLVGAKMLPRKTLWYRAKQFYTKALLSKQTTEQTKSLDKGVFG